jgi:4-amino-4-deoxy-L-arabinose transferase-like glycosyltransferase
MTRRDLWIVLATMAVALLLAAPVLTYPLGRDQGVFATIGRGILNGRVPYVDLWDAKPPAVFYVYAGAIRLFGPTEWAVRVIDLLLFPGMGVALYWLALRLAGRRVGVLAVLAFAAY